MNSTAIRDDDALKKHHVRFRFWLPICTRLKHAVTRRLRYFTFSGGEPLDVHLLAAERLLPNDGEYGFKSVCFFDRHAHDAFETQKYLPGAVPFPGSFTDTLLIDDEEAPPEDGSGAHHEYQSKRTTLDRLVQHLPFDVINFDLEEVLFQAGEAAPGRLMQSVRRFFQLQFDAVAREGNSRFGLMMTIRLPEEETLSEDAVHLIHHVLEENVERLPALRDHLPDEDEWERRFEIAMPKLILQALHAAGGLIEAAAEFQEIRRTRTLPSGEEQVLYHLVCEAAPASRSALDQDEAYAQVAEQLFRVPPQEIDPSMLDAELRRNLRRVHEERDRWLNNTPPV